jgi:Phage related hypothetical protein (DUF1799)
MAGATGLNYQSVMLCMEMQSIPKKQRKELFAHVQAMEVAVLNAQAAKSSK